MTLSASFRRRVGGNARTASFFLWLAAALSVAGASATSEPSRVTPDQIVRDALAHSLALQVSEKEVRAAEARKAQTDSLTKPTLDIEARAWRYEGLEAVSLGGLLTIPAIESRYAASATLAQPIYTGGRITSERENAEHLRRAAGYRRRATEADVVLQALTAYWGWSKAYYSVSALQAAVDRVAAHAADMRNLREAGMATDNDTLATDVLLDQTRLRLEEARRRVKLTRAQLVFLTGRELADAAAPEEAPPARDTASTPETDAAQAVARRPERQALEMQWKASKAQIVSSRADLYPQIFLTARYEQDRPNSLFFPPEDQWQDDAFAGLSLGWQVFDWGRTRASVLEAAQRADQARLRLQQAEEQIALEVTQARIDLEDAGERLPVAARTEDSARRNLEVATDLWKHGLTRHSDVLDAYSQLSDAQYSVTAARADVRLAQASLDHALGREPAGAPSPEKR